MTVTEVLAAGGTSYDVVEHPPARTESELHLTGLDVEQSVKTLAFTVGDDRRVVLVGIPGPARLKYGELARALGVSRSQLRQASADVVQALGMEPGGLSPITDDVAGTVVFDAVVPAMGVVSCGGGTPTRTLVLEAADLVRASPRVIVAPVS